MQMRASKISDTLAGPQLVKNYILENYRVGQKLPSDEELSAKLGTTRYAATRALTEMHAEGNVERKPRKGSFLISQVNKKVTSLISSLNKTKRIAYLSNEFDSFICNELLWGVESGCRSNEHNLSLFNGDYSLSNLRTSLETILEQSYDGAIIRLGERAEDFELLDEVVPEDFPLVILDKSNEDSKFPCVKLNQEQAAFDATSHLVELGHKKIAFVGYNHDNNYCMAELEKRKYGYKRALKEAGLELREDYIQGGHHVLPGERPTDTHMHNVGYEPMNKLLLQKERPTAVFFLNFSLAIGALRAIRDHGLVIPDDMSVICIDDEPAAKFMTPSLSVIAQPLREMGETALGILNNRFNDEKFSEKSIRLQGQLIQRESTARI
jgi:DNA-binding LacI/PurR family transcriptional regulator